MKRAVPVRKVGGANKRAKSGAGDGKSHFNFSDDDEVIDSDGSGISGNEDGSDFFEDVENSDDEKETVQEKRIRLAKSMLDKIAVEEGQGGWRRGRGGRPITQRGAAGSGTVDKKHCHADGRGPRPEQAVGNLSQGPQRAPHCGCVRQGRRYLLDSVERL